MFLFNHRDKGQIGQRAHPTTFTNQPKKWTKLSPQTILTKHFEYKTITTSVTYMPIITIKHHYHQKTQLV